MVTRYSNGEDSTSFSSRARGKTPLEAGLHESGSLQDRPEGRKSVPFCSRSIFIAHRFIDLHKPAQDGRAVGLSAMSMTSSPSPGELDSRGRSPSHPKGYSTSITSRWTSLLAPGTFPNLPCLLPCVRTAVLPTTPSFRQRIQQSRGGSISTFTQSLAMGALKGHRQFTLSHHSEGCRK